mgnify:CR=1 FL=1
MITVRIMGGLGNQLFQYAAARRLAFHNRTELRLDLSGYSRGVDRRGKGLQSFARSVALFNFCITAKEASRHELALYRDRFITASPLHRTVRLCRRIYPSFLCASTHIREQSLAFEGKVLELTDGCYLDGYRQSWKYFADINPLIRQEFQFRDEGCVSYAESYLGAIRRRYGVVVSLHVRRGDLAFSKEILGSKNSDQGELVDRAYMKSAMEQFSSGTAFLIFSDSSKDIEWCRANIKGEHLFFSVGHSDIQDFVLMSRCDHNIIANSTFSWWAAWLNENLSRRVIVPRGWFSRGSRYASLIDDLIPQGWEVL